ncbi:MAG: hypothetical protein ACM3ST_06605 [Bdellovibrio bacteriovorus]
MTHPRTARLIVPFKEASAAYLSSPDLLKAMALAEIAGQLKQAAASELRDDTLTALLHRCLQALRAGDAQQTASLVETVSARLDGLDTHSTAPQSPGG